MGAEDAGFLPRGGLAAEPSNEGIDQLAAPNTAPVIVWRDGKFFQVYEIAKIFCTGKTVECNPGGTELTENIYSDGVLPRHTEWHAIGQENKYSLPPQRND